MIAAKFPHVIQNLLVQHQLDTIVFPTTPSETKMYAKMDESFPHDL